MIQKLFLDTEIAHEIWQLFREIEEQMQLRAPLNMYVAGRAAMHLCDGERVPKDVDAIVDARHWGLAPHLCVPSPRLALDPGYFETKSCLPEETYFFAGRPVFSSQHHHCSQSRQPSRA